MHAAKYRLDARRISEVDAAARGCFNISVGVRDARGYDNIKACRIRSDEESDRYPSRVSTFEIL
jgi:hypothetical protein